MKQWQINILHQLTFCTKMCIFSCMYTSRKTSWSKFNFEEKSKWDLTKKSQFIAWLMMKPTEFSLSIDQDVSRRLGWREKKKIKKGSTVQPPRIFPMPLDPKRKVAFEHPRLSLQFPPEPPFFRAKNCIGFNGWKQADLAVNSRDCVFWL